MAALAKESLLNKLPIIVILGATGTGKSKLALQIAKQFNGEVISADAMQLYKGLDIVTNKVTAEEQKVVPHHMIDYISPGQPVTVYEFRDKALGVIEDLQRRRKLPVIAGGTCYYVESLLWNVLIDTEVVAEPPQKKPRHSIGDLGNLSYLLTEPRAPRDKVPQDPVENLTADEKLRLHRALEEVDPERAEALHPNNVRKVIRSLQVLDTTGRRHSDLIREQRAAGGNHLGGPLRFPDSVILWITCQKEVLDARLDARVDEMISQGLIQELQEFHDQYNLRRMKDEDGGLRTAAYTLGIFQSIGFKEFHQYLMLGKEEREGKEGRRLFAEGIELMKVATRQYAKRQIKWIKQRFLARGEKQVPPLYALNGTDVAHWDSEVKEKAFSIVKSVLDGSPCAIVPEPTEPAKIVDHTLMKCEQCDRLFEGAQQLEVHLKSEKHKRKLRKLAREAGINTSTQPQPATETSMTTIPDITSSDNT